jgi:hypothetical protein
MSQPEDELGEAVLAEAVGAYRAALGGRLVAAYALGSLAHGGFSPLVSDVDLGLVLSDPPQGSDEATLQTVADGVKAGGSPLHERLSVFWGTPATLQGRSEGGRFPPLDRLDLIENGRLLAGVDARQGMGPPTRDELLVVGAEFALEYLGGDRGSEGTASPGLGSMAPAGDETLEEIRHPEKLIGRGPRRLTKIVLFPVRFMFTAQTGRVGTNELAAQHYVDSNQAPGDELVRAALGWRLSPPDDVPMATALLERDLIPLYTHYIDDHAARLTAVQRLDLAEQFQLWLECLLA